MGNHVFELLSTYIALNNSFVAVIVYYAGMEIMGNAFAAFPVLSAAVTLPVLILQMHANPAIVGAIKYIKWILRNFNRSYGNFNIVSAVLLNLDDKNAVIKVQFITGFLLLIVNILLMYFLAFKF